METAWNKPHTLGKKLSSFAPKWHYTALDVGIQVALLHSQKS